MLEKSLSYVIFHVPHDFGPERVECQLCHWLQYLHLHSCASPSASLIWLKRKSSLKGQYLVVEIQLICIWMLKENMIFCSTIVTETVCWFHSFCKSTPPSSIVWVYRVAGQISYVSIFKLIHCTLRDLHLFLLLAVCYSTHASLSSSVSASLFLMLGLIPDMPIHSSPHCLCLLCPKVSFLSQGGSHNGAITLWLSNVF